jgi:hypothetical protein
MKFTKEYKDFLKEKLRSIRSSERFWLKESPYGTGMHLEEQRQIGLMYGVMADIVEVLLYVGDVIDSE